MNLNNIILIGMPGAGKSTIGVLLAKELCYHFLDVDLIIQQQEGKLLCDIIKENGLDRFIQIEESANLSLSVYHCIIATGGSAVYSEKAMMHLKTLGTVIYLRLPCSTLKKRLGNMKRRGVVMRDGQTLDQLYAERSSLYQQYADVTVDTAGLTVEQALDQIIEQLYIK